MFFVSEHTTMFFINFYRSTKSMLERYIFFVTGRQTNIIRTQSSLLEMGSDYLFISKNLRILTSKMA